MRFLVFALLTAAQAGELSQIAAFRQLYRSNMERNAIVGSSFALIHNREVVAEEFYGDANREKHQKVDRNTTYHWASVTKTFTGIAIMQLRDRGLLGLDEPVVKYVPELRAIHNPFGPVEAITIRHLMSHSAGFRNPTWPWSADQPGHAGQDWLPFEPTQWSQLVSMMPYTEVMFPPGSRYSYSNLGVVFLGQIIERLTGDPFAVYIDKNILKPLEMHASYFDQSPYFLLEHRAAGYYRAKGVTSAAPFNFHTGITVSNGGLNAPIPDMVKYLKFLLGAPAPELLKRSSLEEMWHKQLPAEFPGESICLGFFAYDSGGHEYIGHSGQQGGFISHIFIDPERHSAYVVAYNTDITEGTPDTKSIDHELSQRLFQDVFPHL